MIRNAFILFIALMLGPNLAFAQEIGAKSEVESDSQAQATQEHLSDEEATELARIKLEEMENSIDEVLIDTETLRGLRESELVFKDDETDWDIIKSIPRDAWEAIKAPIGWDKKEWVIAGSVVGVTSLLMTQDKRIQDFVQANKSELTEDIAYYAEMGGSQAQYGLAATYIVGAILKNPKLKRASVVAMSSLIISGALNQGLKMLFARERPYRSQDSQWNFHGPGKYSMEHRSFPSGHTTAAFAVAASIATSYDSKLVKILAYTAATLTGISRIHDNKHWASDVFMGAALGTALGIFITKRHMNNADKKFYVTPWMGQDITGSKTFGVQVTIPLGRGKRNRKR